MRRNQKTWQEKLDSFALEAIQARKNTSSVLLLPQGELTEVIKWLKENQQIIKETFDKFPRSEESLKLKTVKLGKGFVKFAQSTNLLEGFPMQPGENEEIPFFADVLENAQKLYKMLEKRREERAMMYFGLAAIYTLARPLVEDFRKKQFRPEPLDWEKKGILAAMCLEFVAKLLRGRVSAPKGRINLELIKFINLLQEHQTEPLTDRDLREASAQAGFYVPTEPHSWSIWLNRMRKRGYIKKSRAKV